MATQRPGLYLVSSRRTKLWPEPYFDCTGCKTTPSPATFHAGVSKQWGHYNHSRPSEALLLDLWNTFVGHFCNVSLGFSDSESYHNKQGAQ